MIRALIILIILFSCNTSRKLPTNNVPVKNNTRQLKLDGSKSYDPDGYIVDWNWKQIAGQSANISNPKAVITTTTVTKKGNYSFELTVTDNDGATGRDTATLKY